MKRILIVAVFFIGMCWGPVEGSVLAAQPPSESSGSQSITAQDLERVIYSALTRQYGRLHHRLSVRIVTPNKPLPAPAGKRQLEIEKLTGGARMGRRAFRIGLYINGQFIRTINVVGEVRAQASVSVPVRWMKSKEVVVEEDVIAMTVDVPSLTHDFILNKEEIIGKQVLRSLPPRRPIRKIMIDDPPIVQKGDRVIIEVRRGGLVVQTVGLAKASGKSGETILVQNKNSGREVIGTVVSASLVEVGF